MDDVEQLVAEWQRERPDADVSPMLVLSRVTRLAKRLDRLRKQAFAAHGLETWEFDVLAALRRSGDPYELSPGQLVRATYVTSGTMTNRVDRLASTGLVERRPTPSDRRGVLVRLTETGKKRVDSALDELLASETILMRGLTNDDRDATALALSQLMQAISDNPRTSE